MNRLTSYAAELAVGLERLANEDAESYDRLVAGMNDVVQSELFTYQQLQAEAFAAGKLTLEEAQWLYQQLGGDVPTIEKWLSRPLATKVTIIKLFSEVVANARRI